MLAILLVPLPKTMYKINSKWREDWRVGLDNDFSDMIATAQAAKENNCQTELHKKLKNDQKSI